MKTYLVKPHHTFRRIFFLASVLILILTSMIPVYADPGEQETSTGGWIEAVCTIVPEDFEGSVSVMVSDVETDEIHTIDCLKVNGFIGRKKLPYGKYFVDRIYTSDTFYYEGFTDLYSFELTTEMPAAQRIEIEVIKNNVPDDVFSGKREEAIEAAETAEPQPDAENAEDSNTEESVQEGDTTSDLEEQKKGTDEQEPQEGSIDEDKVLENNRTTKEILRDIGISLLAMAAFFIVITLLVYVIRTRYCDED